MKRCKLKNKKWTIRTKLIGLFGLFTAGALLLLLMFQLLFLDVFYEYIKISSVQSAANEIAAAVEADNAQEYMEYWHFKEQLDVYLVDADGNILDRETTLNSERDRLNPDLLTAIFREAEAAGGIYTLKGEIVLSTRPSMPEPDRRAGEGVPPDMPTNIMPQKEEESKISETSKTYICAKLATGENNEASCMVLVTAVITPVDATVRTLLLQLLLAAVVLVGFSVVIAWIVARKIAKPIVDINEAAKALAGGEYQSPPEGGYREVAELRRTLEETAVELQKSEQLQRELIANVSHDLRTPLTMITGYSEAIRDLPGENSAENIQVVIDESNRLTRLVNDVLDLSKLQSGTQSLLLETMELSGVLRETVERCRCMTEKQEYVIELSVEKEATVRADELRLSQVIYNLLGNALAHTGEDRRVEVTQTVKDDVVRVTFADSGDGIPEEERERIWQRYYQIRREGTPKNAISTGLGLSIVYTLVQMHGGTCGVDSEVGKGSAFWFELPLLKEESAQ